MAVPNRSRSPVPNDARQCVKVTSLVIVTLMALFVSPYSGNVVIETLFFDGDLLVSTSHVRIFYV